MEKCWRKIALKANSINFMENHQSSWRNAGGILQLIMEKNEKWLF